MTALKQELNGANRSPTSPLPFRRRATTNAVQIYLPLPLPLVLSRSFSVIVVDCFCLAVAFYCCWSCSCCCCSDCCCIFALAFSKNHTNHKKYHGKYSQTQPTKISTKKKRNIHKLFSLHNESTPISREIKQTRRNKSQSKKIHTKTKHTRITYLKS